MIVLLTLLIGCSEQKSVTFPERNTTHSYAVSQNPTSDQLANQIIGSWVVTQYIGYSKISAEEEDKTIIGTKLTFSEEKVSFGNHTLIDPNYRITKLNASEFLDWFDTLTEFNGLNVDSTILVEVFIDQVMDKEWDDTPLRGFFVKDENTLIAYHKGGMFYQLSKVDNHILGDEYNITDEQFSEMNVEVSYPQITNMADKRKMKVLNSLIKKDILTKAVIKDAAIEVSYEIKRKSPTILSISYLGNIYASGSVHPSNLFYATNIDINNELILSLSDLVKISPKFSATILVKGKYVPWDAKLDLQAEGVLDEMKSDYNAEEITKVLDSFPYYLTEDVLGISLPTAHAVGDHVEFEIMFSDLLSFKTDKTFWDESTQQN